jgi:hypothetical protein
MRPGRPDRQNEWIRDWTAGLLLTLEVLHSGAIDVDASWTFPLNQGANFVLALTGNVTGSGERIESMNVKVSMGGLKKEETLCAHDNQAASRFWEEISGS